MCPESGIGHIGIGDCMAALGNKKAAKLSYLKAIEVDKGVSELAREKTAKLLYDMKDYPTALKEYEKVNCKHLSL